MKSVLLLLVGCALLGSGCAGQAPQRHPTPPPAPVADPALLADTARLEAEVAAHPEDPALAIQLADTLAQRGLFSEAITTYQTALRLDDANAAGWHNLALCYERQGLYRESREAALMASTLEPEDKFLTHEAARIDVLLRQGESGERVFTSKVSQAYIALALHTPEGLTRATAYTEDLMRSWPQLADTWNVAGIVALRNQDTATAKERFDKAIELNPKVLQARYNRALLAWNENDVQTAAWQLEALKNLLKDDARSVDYLERLLADLADGKSPAESRIEARQFEKIPSGQSSRAPELK